MTIKFKDMVLDDPMRGLNKFLEDETPNKFVKSANKVISRHDIMFQYVTDNGNSCNKFLKYLNEFIEQETEEENLLVVDEAVKFRTEIKYIIGCAKILKNKIKNMKPKGEL